MYDWCHTGLEGYCKAAADVLATEDDDGVVLGLCLDILPDRVTDSGLSRTWTLSNIRRGPNNRLSLFEKCWLADRSAKEYREEAARYVSRTRPLEELPTISGDPEYARRLEFAVSAAERNWYATEHCARRAITACVDRIIRLSQDDPELVGVSETPDGDGRQAEVAQDSLRTQAATVTSLVCLPDFVSLFFARVMPAMERGFLSERYRPSDINQFAVTLTGLIEPAHRCLTGGGNDLGPYRRFLESLVAGLVYGPTHPIAMGRPRDATLAFEPYGGEQVPVCSGIRLTQVFDDAGGLTGYSEVYHPGQVVFFGRSPDVAEYLTASERVFRDGPDLLEAVRTREAVVFPMALQEAVGNCHAVLLCDVDHDLWRLYELGPTTNGTSIAVADETVEVDGLVVLRAGDRIRLGAPADACGASVFWVAATVAFSLNVDRNAELV